MYECVKSREKWHVSVHTRRKIIFTFSLCLCLFYCRCARFTTPFLITSTRHFPRDFSRLFRWEFFPLFTSQQVAVLFLLSCEFICFLVLATNFLMICWFLSYQWIIYDKKFAKSKNSTAQNPFMLKLQQSINECDNYAKILTETPFLVLKIHETTILTLVVLLWRKTFCGSEKFMEIYDYHFGIWPQKEIS